MKGVEMEHTLSGHVTLITGASGSFGKAFIRHVLADPTFDGQIIGLSRNAEMRYHLEQRQLADVKVGRLVVVPGDVRQVGDLVALESFGITTIIHACAEKHIGTGERFVAYTHSVNYTGTLNAVSFAQTVGAGRFLLLSTDKATRGVHGEPPANYYGETKRGAELICTGASVLPGTVIAATRYGNVIHSSGSVLPLFLEQRKAGVLTVTDLRMTRFAMPIDDEGSNGARVRMQDGRGVTSAVGLVLDALAHMTPGAIFVPAIPSHHVRDLAATVGRGCEIVEVGIRPGERLHEVLIAPSEANRTWARAEGGWVILPTPEDEWPGGRRVPEDFHFSSDQNPLAVEWLEAA
jgi:UDP-N-acetylglucosamine 4,6-dehydratase